jgi:hypothetical protein
MTDEAACNFGREQHARALRGQLARVQSRDGAHARLASDGLRGFQVAPVIASCTIALHVVAGLCQQHRS